MLKQQHLNLINQASKTALKTALARLASTSARHGEFTKTLARHGEFKANSRRVKIRCSREKVTFSHSNSNSKLPIHLSNLKLPPFIIKII